MQCLGWFQYSKFCVRFLSQMRKNTFKDEISSYLRGVL